MDDFQSSPYELALIARVLVDRRKVCLWGHVLSRCCYAATAGHAFAMVSLWSFLLSVCGTLRYSLLHFLLNVTLFTAATTTTEYCVLPVFSYLDGLFWDREGGIRDSGSQIYQCCKIFTRSVI